MRQPVDLEFVAKEWCASSKHKFVASSGQGAFKQTFKVSNPDGDLLALKVFKANPNDERSHRELEAMRRCDHPNVVKVLDVGSCNVSGQTFGYIVEPFITGGTLTSYLRQTLLDRNEVQILGEQLIDGCSHIGALRLVHRDIKPDNIMLNGQGINEPIIVDFGLVRDLEAVSITKTFLANGPGTPLYASPEQLNNDKALIDSRSDQFSLGIVLALAFTGIHPFDTSGSQLLDLLSSGDAPRLNAIVSNIVQRRTVDTSIKDKLAKNNLGVLVKMLTPYPVERFLKGDDLAVAWNKQRGSA